MVTINHGVATDTGNLRPQNEDSYLVSDRLVAVADGMGGHNAGEVASAMAVALLQERTGDDVITADAFVDVITTINRTIYEEATSASSQRGMGTTLAAVLMVADDAVPHAIVANVGDSRTYLFRDGELRQVSVDHSYVQELVTEGIITADEARSHPRRNIVTRALGIDPNVMVDTWTIPLMVGDRFMLCSDGLVDEVAVGDITSILAGIEDPTEASRQLVAIAKARAGRDNITVAIFDVGSVEPGAVLIAPTTRRKHSVRRLVAAAVALLFFVSIVGGAIAAAAGAARDGYFVAFDGEEADAILVIKQGSPKGWLWIKPTTNELTTITRRDVLPALERELDRNPRFSDLASAQRYVSAISEVIDG
jgi:serine/threonine protein phosphatase PrpC